MFIKDVEELQSLANKFAANQDDSTMMQLNAILLKSVVEFNNADNGYEDSEQLAYGFAAHLRKVAEYVESFRWVGEKV